MGNVVGGIRGIGDVVRGVMMGAMIGEIGRVGAVVVGTG